MWGILEPVLSSICPCEMFGTPRNIQVTVFRVFIYIITLFLGLAAMSWQVSQLSSCFPTHHSSLSSPVLSVTKRKETLSAHHLHLPHQSSWHCPLSPLYYPSTAAEPESTTLPNTPTTQLRPGCCTVFLDRSASGWCTRPGGRPPLPARPKWDNEGRERWWDGLWERSPVPHQSWHTIKIWVGLICQASSLSTVLLTEKLLIGKAPCCCMSWTLQQQIHSSCIVTCAACDTQGVHGETVSGLWQGYLRCCS